MPPILPSWLIAVSTIIGSPIAGGWLLAKNYQRLKQSSRGKKAAFWGVSIALLLAIIVFFTWSFLPVLLLPLFCGSAYYVASEVKFGEALKSQAKADFMGAVLPTSIGAIFTATLVLFMLNRNAAPSYQVLPVGDLAHQVRYQNMTINESGNIARALVDAGHFGNEFQTYVICSRNNSQTLIYIPAFQADWQTNTLQVYMKELKAKLVKSLGPDIKLYAIDEQEDETLTLEF